MTTVYLAGPINGCTDDEAIDWRQESKEWLSRFGLSWLDPMRRDYRGIEDQSVNEIVHGDLADIDASDVMLANCWQVSWGTGMEIHYAHTVGKRVIAVLPPKARVSPWLRYHAEVVTSLAAALDLTVQEATAA